MADRARTGGAAAARPHYPRTLRARSNIPVVAIARRSRHLLLYIESRSPLWHYREDSRNAYWLAVAARLPDVLQAALVGGTVARLIATGTPLDAVTIADFGPERNGWTDVRLAPQWVRR